MSGLTKAAVDASLVEVVRYFAGEPVRAETDPSGRTRHTHCCPGCGREALSAVVFPDANPPGSGVAGCSADDCPVPKRAGALGLIAHFRKLSGKGKTALALAAAQEILLADAPTSHQKLSLGAAEGPPPAPAISLPGPAAVVGDEGDVPAEAPPEADLQPTIFANAAAAEEALVQDEEPAGAPPQTLTPERNPQGRQLEADLDRRDRVYSALLSLCPPDAPLFSFFAERGITDAVVRGGRFGLYRHEESSEILSALMRRFGTETLISVGGFAPPADSYVHALATGRGPRLSLGVDDAALIPYTDARGRVTALELVPLGDPDSARLMGADDAGRDPGLGGSNHLWSPCPPADVEAVADSLPEAMRASAAGIRCAAIRSPQAFRGPTGEDAAGSQRPMPELLGVRFAAPRILYAPNTSDRSRASAQPAARAVLCRAGATALVAAAAQPSEKPTRDRPAGDLSAADMPWSWRVGSRPVGLGSYLLSLAGGREPRQAFDALFDGRSSVALHADDAPRADLAPATAQAARDGGGPKPDVSRAAFERELRKRPRRPSSDPGFSTSEAGRGTALALGAFLLVFPPTLLLLGPLASNLADVLLVGGGGASAPDPSDPSALLFGLVADIFKLLLWPVAYPVALLASALDSVLGAALLCALFSSGFGLLHARRCRRFRFRRLEIMDGRVMNSRVLVPWRKRAWARARLTARRRRRGALSRALTAAAPRPRDTPAPAALGAPRRRAIEGAIRGRAAGKRSPRKERRRP